MPLKPLMMNPLYEIIDYEVFPRKIVASVEIGQVLKDFDINRRQYEDWLERDGRLSWEMNYVDHSGNHQQKTGKYETKYTGNLSTVDYWSLDKTVIHQDLYDYLLTHPKLINLINNRIYEL